jgi:pimeloyl-ACP methyl ester carboxylesterase
MNQKFGEYYISVVDSELDAVDAAFPEQGRPGGWMVWAQYVSMGQRHDYRVALAQVDAPTLVIHGADDLQSEAISRMYATAFPKAEFAVIKEASHFSFKEQPEQFAQIIAEFLSRVK